MNSLKTHSITIVSGCQTGVDRAALDAALELGIHCGGWVPSDRMAEDGLVSDKYPVKPLQKGSYKQRTRRNVEDSDGTIIIYPEYPTGGTELTLRFCLQFKKPYLLIDASEIKPDRAAVRITAFIDKYEISKVNFAGPKYSGWNLGYEYTYNSVSAFLRRIASR